MSSGLPYIFGTEQRIWNVSLLLVDGLSSLGLFLTSSIFSDVKRLNGIKINGKKKRTKNKSPALRGFVLRHALFSFNDKMSVNVFLLPFYPLD